MTKINAYVGVLEKSLSSRDRLSCALLLSLSIATFSLEGFAEKGAGRFSAGKSQLSIGGGSSQLLGSNYLILQGRYGYFFLDGLVAELGGQAWIPLSGDFGSAYLISPGLTAYLYQAGVIIPYIGGFYQYAIADFELISRAAIGGRGGILLQQGGSFLGLGIRVTQGLDCEEDCRELIPEISLLLSF